MRVMSRGWGVIDGDMGSLPRQKICSKESDTSISGIALFVDIAFSVGDRVGRGVKRVKPLPTLFKPPPGEIDELRCVLVECI